MTNLPIKFEPKFPLGRIVATSGALHLMLKLKINPWSLLTRHAQGDWGQLDREDAARNDEAVTSGYRILSAYDLTKAHNGAGLEDVVSDQSEQPVRLWVITEHDRSVTTILKPSEY